MKTIDRLALVAIAGVSVIAAAAITAATAWHPPVTTAAATTSAADRHVSETLVVATPAMLDNKDMPAFLPSSLTLPANSTVTITVVNFDDATALPKGSEQYAVPQGVVGALSVQPLDPTNPNAEAQASSVTSMDPQTGVSHTFTVSQLGINVPIAPKSRTTFTIRTGKAGTYTWQCFVPCGTDPAGWGGAMAATGFMRGTMTIA